MCLVEQNLLVGTFSIPFSSLQDPPPSLKIRDVKEWYVDYLVDLLTEDDQEDLSSPPKFSA